MDKPIISLQSKVGGMDIQTYERYLPTAFDDSMTLLQKVNKVIEYLNTIGAISDSVVEQWNQVMEWVMSDGLSEGVENRINDMFEDGTLGSLINTTLFSGLIEDIAQIYDNPIQYGAKANANYYNNGNVYEDVNYTIPALDNSPFIQAALDKRSELGGGEVKLPRGKYLVNTEITIPSNITLKGDGDSTVLIAGNSNYSMIKMNGNDGCVLKDIKLDGRAEQRQNANLLSESVYGVKMGRSQSCVVDNVTFVNLGYTLPSTNGGNFIDVSVAESYEANGGGRDTKLNVIKNCRLYDPQGRASFGIRLWTTWALNKTVEQYRYKVSDNLIYNNYFEGFNWNCIEIAGPNTKDNTIEKNNAYKHVGFSAIEADKGASYNTFINNTVKDTVPRADGAGQYCFRDQRSGIADGNFYNYNCIDNKWIGNLADGLTQNATATSGGMLIDGSNGCIVENLHIRNIGGTLSDSIAGIVVMGDATNLIIDGGKIKTARTGIFLSSCTDSLITNVIMYDLTYGVKTSTLVNDISLDNLIVKDCASTGINLVSDNVNIEIKDCKIKNCNKAIVTGASITVIKGCIISSITDVNNGIDARGGFHTMLDNKLNGCRIYVEGDSHHIVANINDINSSTYTKRTMFGSGVPTTDKWRQGDIKYNSSPTSGAYVGWICTTTGVATSTQWSASTSFTVGQIVYSGSKVYTCTTAGVSGTVAPSVSSGTVNDGSVVWTYLDSLAVFKTFGLIS